MNQPIDALGNLIRLMRKRKNLSQAALAERLGVCKRTIIDIEKNTGNPRFELLCALVRELELPLYQVFYPEVDWNGDVQSMIIRELQGCSDYELKIILAVVRSLREAIEDE